MRKTIDRVETVFRLAVLAGLLLASAWGGSASAQESGPQDGTESAVVLLDGSGSMSGFGRTGSLWNLGERLCAEFEPRLTCRQRVFTSSTETGEDLKLWTVEDFRKTPGNWGSRTHLEQAYTRADRDADIFFVVTDNVYSAKDRTLAQGIMDFYGRFRGAGALRAILAPVRLAFKGTV